MVMSLAYHLPEGLRRIHLWELGHEEKEGGPDLILTALFQ